jgi:hypothetical protein
MKKAQRASHIPAGLAVEYSVLLSAANQERVLREASLDRARAQGQLLAALFALPSRIIAWRLPDRARLALQAALHRNGVSLRRER